MNILFDLIGSIAKPIINIFQTDSETKRIKIEGKHKIQQGKINLKISNINAKISKIKATAKETQTNSENNMTYDMQVLRNRNRTLMDEFLMIWAISLVTAHFIPGLQKHMALGWEAMGYSSPPAWLNFIILGMFVSTLGLRGLLPMSSKFFRKSNKKEAN